MYIGTPGIEIEPFYFGTSGKPLFGCYHAPQSGGATPRIAPYRDCGVVLCYPMGHEYIQSHRAYRQLAVRLSKVGFHVLRFDYYGCGDSGGDCEQGAIRQWLTDISTAIDEIRDRNGFVKVCLVGLRLGGTLSMMLGAKRGDIEGLVLWDAVVSGRAYLEELTTLHQEKFRYLHAKPNHHITDEKPIEVLGFSLTDFMRRELDKIDLTSIQKKPANNILLIESSEEAGEGRLREHLKSMDTYLTYQHLPSPQIWIENINKIMMPIQILQSVVSWILEVYP